MAVVEVQHEGREENSDLCGSVWRFGVKEEMRREEWREGSRGSCEREFFFFF